MKSKAENIDRFGIIYLTGMDGNSRSVSLKSINTAELKYLLHCRPLASETRLTERKFGAEISFCVEEKPKEILDIIEYHDEYFSSDVRGFLERNGLVAIKGEKF